MIDEQVQTILQPTEAGFSTNLFLNHPMMGRVQFTFRGATSQDWELVLLDLDHFLRHMKEKGWNFDGVKPTVSTSPETIPTVPSEPVRQPIDDNGNDLPEIKCFTADKLSVTMKDDKYYYKVIGGVFRQYGVTVWPEVLAAAGLDVSPGQPVPNIAGWRADYIEEPGKEPGKKRMKITRLLPPK